MGTELQKYGNLIIIKSTLSISALNFKSLCAQAFRGLPYRVVWKLDEDLHINNVMTGSWFPQQVTGSQVSQMKVVSRVGILGRSPNCSTFREPRDRFQGINFASLAGRYDNPIPARFLAPIDFLKFPAPVYERRNRFLELSRNHVWNRVGHVPYNVNF
jgi:hypothetical protein